jgi:hypothetical protein
LQLASPLSGSARTPRASALYVSLSVPTGDPDELLGSGAFSFSSWISGRRRTGVKDWPVTLHGTLGGTLIEHVGVLADMRNPFVGIASGGFQWHLTPTVAVGADFNFHSPLYRASELSSLTSSALAVAFGGSVRLGKTGQLELALVEDLDNSTSPDVTIHAALSWSH